MENIKKLRKNREIWRISKEQQFERIDCFSRSTVNLKDCILTKLFEKFKIFKFLGLRRLFSSKFLQFPGKN